ncbi:EAL domain-containing protein [Pseudodesulfovibrio cashew]|uniref:EAL domain-containing protein n=1 Tax=Pseudodesulfovibrio cashew TaxID=2678688 RepID=A0A6I6JGU5_9BACT|nr:EAL domain-containing protein [Pseudodesulfovibrio cashew]QGY39592.1 EAL domain-containing protein [Pseudodesulfovibrio cashew]
MSDQSKKSYEKVFVARQPVFRPDETLWGYELLFRSGRENMAVVVDESEATSSVIADGLIMALEGVDESARILINFPEQMLLEDVGFALPRETCVIEILENVRPSKKTLAAVRRLKEAGYTIAVDDYFGQPQLKPFIDLADIVKIDLLELGSDPDRVAEAVEAVPVSGVELLGEKVEDEATFRFLKDLGFTLFQGFFFSKPEILPGRKLSANETTKLQLLSELSSEGLEPARLAEILQSDPSLSYRLFRYINSVGFGLRSKVTSLKRAIDMMGMLQAKQWLRTVVLADMNTTPKGGELAFMAVHRARFLESFCSLSSDKPCNTDVLFIVGLFSLLDSMLGMKMVDILETLPLDDEVKRGLTSESDAHDYLHLAACYERGQWEETVRIIERHGLDVDQVDAIYARARIWAQEMMGHASPPEEADVVE